MNLREALHWASNQFFQKKVDSPRLTAELLLGFVLNLSRLELQLQSNRNLSPAQRKRFENLVKKRSRRIPLQHLIGECEFLDFKVKVTPQVLIPRPETEEVFEFFLQKYLKLPQPRPAILDLGTGSGVLALACARQFPGQMIYACDISKAALGIAKVNAQKLGVKNVRWFCGNFLEAFPKNIFSNPVWIITNPPYIANAQGQYLSPEVLRDPKLALFAGRDGLQAFRIIANQLQRFVQPGSVLIAEMGFNQQASVSGIFKKYFEQVSVLKDLREKNRIFFGKNFLNTL